MLFGPEAMASRPQLEGASLHYTATFLFTPCALPAPMTPGWHQTYCRRGVNHMS